MFSEQAPFGQDLAGLLHPGAELDALGWETDLEQAVRRIKEIQPHAVIVVGQDVATDCGPAVSRIQTECPDIQIAEINLETRVVCIYGKDDQIVQDLRDLLSAVGRRSAAERDGSLAH